jgi:hypothetical protein
VASTTGARSRKHTSTQAIQTDQQDIAALRKQQGQRTKQFHKEAGSTKAATQQAIALVRSQNLGGLRGTPEGNQLAKEWAGRAHSLKANLPYALAPIQSDYKGDMAGLTNQLGQAQLGLQQDQADRFKAINDILQTRAQNQAAKATAVDSAYKEALRLIHEQTLVNKDPNADDSDKGSPVPQTELEWMRFEEHLNKTSGIDDRSARKAIKRIRRDQLREQARALAVTPHKYLSSPPLYQP